MVALPVPVANTLRAFAGRGAVVILQTLRLTESTAVWRMHWQGNLHNARTWHACLEIVRGFWAVQTAR
jgi:hypothetical protein